jgi:hypothetical protein
MDKVARMLRPSEIYVNIADLLFRHDSDAKNQKGLRKFPQPRIQWCEVV